MTFLLTNYSMQTFVDALRLYICSLSNCLIVKEKSDVCTSFENFVFATVENVSYRIVLKDWQGF